MQIRDRVVELRRVRAGDLAPNPANWRTHPQAQQDALRGILAEIGYADVLLARELQDGRLMLVDGHARAELTPDSIVPVVVLDVTEDEARKLLLSLDPLAGMAGADDVRLANLLAEVETESGPLQELFDGLAREYDLMQTKVDGGGGVDAQPPEEFKQVDENIKVKHTCPRCGYAWSGGEGAAS